MFEDDLLYEVEGKMIAINNDIDESLIGGNAATETTEEDESVESSVVKGINVVLTHKLQATCFDKKSWKVYIKDYAKAVLEKLDGPRKAAFKTGLGAIVTKLVENKEIWEHGAFYTGESMNPEGMVIIQLYRDDGITPYFIFFKDGVKGTKC